MPLSVNALPLMCDKDSLSENEEFVLRKEKCTTVRGVHNKCFLARDPPSSGRTAVFDSRGHIRWEVAQRELASTCNLFLSVQGKKRKH